MRRFRDDSGIAMITAILVTLAVAAMAVGSFQLAGHDLTQSANDRRRVQAIHAAEAGVDKYLDYLANSAPIASPAGSLSAETLSVSPSASFTATAVYHCNADGTGIYGTDCSTSSNGPLSAVITSIGRSASVSRTMTAFVGLAPTPGGYTLGGAAVYANGAASWTGQATVTNAVGTELAANLYSNGDLDLKGGGTVYGQVEAQGFINLSGATDVKNFVTAKGALSVSNNSIVRGNARSSTSTLTNGGVINGNAYYCTGSAPGGTVGGSKIAECPNPAQPPVQTFKGFTYNSTDWSTRGYNVNNFTTCSAAQTFLSNLGSSAAGNYVVRITNTCSTTIPTVSLKGSLAIISDGDIGGTGSTTDFTSTMCEVLRKGTRATD